MGVSDLLHNSTENGKGNPLAPPTLPISVKIP